MRLMGAVAAMGPVEGAAYAATRASSSESALSGGVGEPFCQGSMGGMVMYMDGFHFGLRGDQPCLNLYFPTWTLDTRAKYLTAVLGVFFLGVAVEGGGRLRRALVARSLRSAPPRRPLAPTAAYWRRLERLQWDRLLFPALHAAQACLGYVLMLAAMTFAVELLLAAVLGLGTGHALFARDVRDSMVPAVAVDPCCPFPPETERTGGRGALGAAEGEYRSHDGEEGNVSPDSTTPLMLPGDSHHLI